MPYPIPKPILVVLHIQSPSLFLSSVHPTNPPTTNNQTKDPITYDEVWFPSNQTKNVIDNHAGPITTISDNKIINGNIKTIFIQL